MLKAPRGLVVDGDGQRVDRLRSVSERPRARGELRDELVVVAGGDGATAAVGGGHAEGRSERDAGQQLRLRSGQIASRDELEGLAIGTPEHEGAALGAEPFDRLVEGTRCRHRASWRRATARPRTVQPRGVRGRGRGGSSVPCDADDGSARGGRRATTRVVSATPMAMPARPEITTSALTCTACRDAAGHATGMRRRVHSCDP